LRLDSIIASEMFSPWIYKRSIFGIDIDIEFDFWGSIFKTWQTVYEFRLKNLWNNSKNSQDFMKFALRHLPNRSSIIFFFDETEGKFVQFMKNGTNIILDIPVWETNEYFNQNEALMKIFKKTGIKKNAIRDFKQEESRSTLKVDFGNHNAIASRTALEICKTIFEKKNPELINYKTGILVSVSNP